MARLIVEAIVTNGLVRAGTSDPVPVTVSVTHADGTPVSTLTAADFTVGDTWGTNKLVVSAFQGGNYQIGLGAVNAGGLYTFELTPLGNTWTPISTYHVVIVVLSGNNHGQTIAALTFPSS